MPSDDLRSVPGLKDNHRRALAGKLGITSLRALADADQRASAVIGLAYETHEESILVDRVGRLQLPKEALDHLPFHGRANVRIFEDHVEIWPRDGRGK